MTCKKCKWEFCWVCMGPWSEHGTAWYQCNRFEEKSGLNARDAQARSRASLERYLHVSQSRFHNLKQIVDDIAVLQPVRKSRQLGQARCRVLQADAKENGADAIVGQPLVDRSAVRQAGFRYCGQGEDHLEMVVLHGVLVSRTLKSLITMSRTTY